MRVLVSAASRHGATREIAATIGEVLTARGLDVTVASPDEIETLADFDAFVIGSAVYLGKWMTDARSLIQEHFRELGNPKVWLFSSGPIGDVAEDEIPRDVGELIDLTRAIDHRVFAGRLDRKKLNLVEKIAVKAAKSPDGDFRDFDEVKRWADDIADRLVGSPIEGVPV